MTPTEKASNLVEYFWTEVEEYKQYETIKMTKDMAKQCALFCVEEITKEHCHNSEHKNPIEQDKWIQFWIDVKKEVGLL